MVCSIALVASSDATLRERLGAVCPDVRVAEPMAHHTTYGCGGSARCFAVPTTAQQVLSIMKVCRELAVPWIAIGGGSNLLVADDGIDAVVVQCRGLRGIDVVQASPPVVEVAAGEPTTSLLGRAIRAGWTGLEFLAGLPGTIGGGVAMNAGTPDGYFDGVTAAVTIAFGDEVQRLSAADVGFRYRGTALPEGSVVLSATLQLRQGESAEVRRAAEALKDRRKKSQPYGARSAGSVFKNPPGDHAGRLIDSLGLKGASLGQARVSEIHANFIVAKPGARAWDVYRLAHYVRSRVQKAYQIELELEVKTLGRFGVIDEAALYTEVVPA